MNTPTTAGATAELEYKGAERRVERPPGVEPAVDHRPQRKQSTDDVDVPADQIDLRERQILRPDHQRNQEIPHHRRNRGNQEEENHRHAVHREHAVVLIRRKQVSIRSQQVQADHHREEAADEKEKGHGSKVEERNPFVVRGQQPRADPIRGVQIMFFRQLQRRSCRLRSHTISSPLTTAQFPRPLAAQAATAET